MNADYLELYPEIEPYDTGHLNVGQGHTIYWESCGNPGGIPVVFLHGGPGGSIYPRHRRLFDPQRYRIILFDQRGCGKSTPFASMNDNTTDHLVADMNLLRQHCGITQWALFGYSWGSALAMAYVTQHTNHVSGVMLGGVFLGRPQEVRDFLLPDGVGAALFPDAYQNFLSPLTETERTVPFASYITIFHHPKPDDAARLAECIRQWLIWETTLMVMQYPLPADKLVEIEQDIARGQAFSIALLETHYIGQDCFLDTTRLLQQLHRLGHVPCTIINGRVDAVCPPQTAWDVHQRWPNSTLEFIPFGSHWTRQPCMTDAMLRQTNGLAEILER